MADQIPPFPGTTPATQQAAPQADKTPLTKIVEIAAATADTAEPGTPLRALAHVVRLLTSRTLDHAKSTNFKLAAQEQQLKKLRAEVDEMAQLLVAMHEAFNKPHDHAAPGPEDVAGEGEQAGDEGGEQAEAAPAEGDDGDGGEQAAPQPQPAKPAAKPVKNGPAPSA